MSEKNNKNVLKVATEKKLVSSTTDAEEINLLNCVQILLRHHNIERSHASIRSMADVSNGPFDYKDAVTCLQNMDFDSNVGKLSPSKLNQGHCPLIVELADKEKRF